GYAYPVFVNLLDRMGTPTQYCVYWSGWVCLPKFVSGLALILVVQLVGPLDARKKEKSLDYNNSFLGEYECSSLALDREERRGGEDWGFDSNEEEVVPKVDDVSLVDEVFDGAFGGDKEEDVVMGEGVVVTSSSLKILTKSCLGKMMVSLIFLKGLEEEA
nr:hypothetical protein [Tanacetum cinerariifolium]